MKNLKPRLDSDKHVLETFTYKKCIETVRKTEWHVCVRTVQMQTFAEVHKCKDKLFQNAYKKNW